MQKGKKLYEEMRGTATVIGTILMVIISLVITALLYFWVMSFFK